LISSPANRWMRAARTLLALLERERALLRTGALREAADLAAQKERLSAELADPPRNAGQAERDVARDLQIGITRNRLLLGACLEAVRAARQRVTEIDRAQRNLGVYDQSGGRPVASPTGKTRDHRA